jgi:hypothetical protein
MNDLTDDLTTSAERADHYGQLADEADSAEATTFTAHSVYVKATRLRDALDAKLRAADVIRGTQERKARKTPAHAVPRSKWAWPRRLVRLR